MTLDKEKVVRVRDTGFQDEIVETGEKCLPEIENLRTCIQCGTCVGGCPSGRRTAWRIKTLFQKAAIGLRDEVLKSDDLWACTTCYTCEERCPRNVPTTDVVRVIRNLAFRAGLAKKPHLATCSYLFKAGHAVPIDDKTKALRKKLGLSELPPTTHSFPEALKQVNLICEKIGFKSIWEEQWKKAQEQK